MLEAVGVTVSFHGLRALDEVSLTLRRGEILGLIGPNGSGKTTLVNAITGHVPVVAGRIATERGELTGRPPHEIARSGVVRSFQIVRLFDGLTVRENVLAGAFAAGRPRAVAEREAEELLAGFGLADRAHLLGGELAYGDKRRVEIARALATRPDYLLLDEPAAGMNEAESAQLLELLARLPAERELGLLVIDHDMALILRLCHRLQVLASGRTIAEGEVEAVRRHPEVVAAYLGTETEAERAPG